MLQQSTVPNISSFKFIYVDLLLQHYTIELKGNNIDLTEDGVAHAEIILGTDDLWDEDDPWARCSSLFLLCNMYIFIWLQSFLYVSLLMN